ncbi:MAG: Hsp20/alpha crystallin family protein [Archangiaceae bacterium]|nr:Hsp20/alpha crystallin family protein [Archangiaceae bacterium]
MANLANRGTWDPFAGLLAEYGFPVARYVERELEAFTPRFEVKETKEALILKADLPGVKTDDLDVSVHSNVLSVSGRREQEAKKDDEHFHMVERSFGAFTRSFTLPETVDTKALDAELKDGVLTITLPKAPEAKPQRVQIKVSK